jgi:hypothetical protein
MPTGITPGEDAKDYSCAQGVAAIWLAQDQQRRTPHKVAGHEAADGGATSDGWLHQEEQRTSRRNSIA